MTVPACWYLLSNAPDASHGHDDHGGSHGAAHGKEHEEEEEGEKAEDAEGKEEESEKYEDSESEDESKDQETPDTSEDEGGDEKNNKKTSPDAKGGIKKRSESKAAIKAGENDNEVNGRRKFAGQVILTLSGCDFQARWKQEHPERQAGGSFEY